VTIALYKFTFTITVTINISIPGDLRSLLKKQMEFNMLLDM